VTELSRPARALFDFVGSAPPTPENRDAARLLFHQLDAIEREKVARLLDGLAFHVDDIFRRSDLENSQS
jgi:hypothetical protein